jgi:hypothetical protein
VSGRGRAPASLVPVYAALTAILAVAAGRDGWAGDSYSVPAWLAIVVGELGLGHAFLTFLIGVASGGWTGSRRAQTVLSRPLREGRDVWAFADGDRVGVYRIAKEQVARAVPWRLTPTSRAAVVEGREFEAGEADEAYRYAAEIEASQWMAAHAVQVARALNSSA